jgi:hypothetical protein
VKSFCTDAQNAGGACLVVAGMQQSRSNQRLLSFVDGLSNVDV